MTQIANVIFDMGGVLMSFDGAYFSRSFTESEQDAELLNRALFGSGEWPLRDAGAVDDETIAFTAKSRLPERLHPALERALAGWTALSDPVPGMAEVVWALKRGGAGLYVLSNAGMNIEDQLRRSPAYEAFDGVVFSAAERVMKPDARLYRTLCDRYALDPQACLFVDDNALNVAGAERVGMSAYRFDGNVEAFKKALASYGLTLA